MTQRDNFHKNKRNKNGRDKNKSTVLKRVGLARAMAKLGYCSRSRAAELIRAGHMKLNGALRRDPETPVHLGKDRIEMDGQVFASTSKVYLILNKPRGVVTTASDEKGGETVYAYLPKDVPWIAPVGRLDKASEGLLLLTNDSEWAAQIAAPETHLGKTYHVQIGAIADEALLDGLRKGMRAEDGEWLQVKRSGVLRAGERNCWLEIVLDEGKNRQIRRLLEHFGIRVLRREDPGDASPRVPQGRGGASFSKEGIEVKTRRIRIAKGEVAHVYLVKRQPVVKFYSTVDATGNGTEQKIVRPGIRATMTLHGPVSVNIVVERKKKER